MPTTASTSAASRASDAVHAPHSSDAASTGSETSFDHLRALTDDLGIFEHALLDVPRREHGYCVDDAARALVLLVREPVQDEVTARGIETFLRMLEAALEPDGRAHNRRSAEGMWADGTGLGDWWGRLVHAAGVTAAHAGPPLVRRRARRLFLRAAARRSPHQRSAVFAALGAGELLLVEPGLQEARDLVLAADALIGTSDDPHWPWPEPRLRYANAAVPEALILGGAALGDPAMTARGLTLLDFLLRTETRGGVLSPTGTQGRGPNTRGPLFDQQPIEVAAIADACARAFEVTGEEDRLEGVVLAWAWFLGANDARTPMVDPATGAGYDGLERGGRNENRGAESTIAALSTRALATRYGLRGPHTSEVGS